jgi:hypothetical protein
MFGRKAVIGICCGIALLGSAALASNASAFRWQTCVPGGFGFGDAHCTRGLIGFHHEAIPGPGHTPMGMGNGATNEETTAAEPWKLEGTISGFETAIECTSVEGTGWVENTEEPTSAIGSVTLTYTGCSVPKPAGIGCKVKEGKIAGQETTFKAIEAEAIEVKPVGTKLASITIEGCSTAALNKTFPLTGHYLVKPKGATWATSHALGTGQGTLVFGGQVAGQELVQTLRMFPTGNPISLT